MQLHNRIWIGCFVMLAIGAMPFSFAETEPVDDTFELSEVVVTGTKTERRGKGKRSDAHRCRV